VTSAAPRFSDWLDDFFDVFYRLRPVSATFIGIHHHDDRLPDCSEVGFADGLGATESLLARLRALPPEPGSESERIDRRLAEGFLEIDRWERLSRHFQAGNPSFYTGEAVFGVLSLFLHDYAPAEERVRAAVGRLGSIPALLGQGESIRLAPAAWLERARRECRGALAFLGEGIEVLIEEYGTVAEPLRAPAARAASAFSEFDRHLLEDVANAEGGYAVGGEAFDRLLRSGHFIHEGASRIEEQAWEAILECEGLLARRAPEFGAASWREVLDQLALRHPGAPDYYSRYQEIWDACRHAAESHDLLTWPDAPLRYVPQPRWARGAAPDLYFLFYRSPPAHHRPPVTDYLVTPVSADMPPSLQEALLRATPDAAIKLNHVVHHGAIGHHVQNAFAYRARSAIARVAAVDCASRIAMLCGGTIAEGWACYATDLMDEIGFLTPLEHYAQIHSRLRMAARAVVDVRLHHECWSFEEAVAFYGERVGMTPVAARAEATKNSMFPGTGLMYFEGCRRIHGLRREVAARQGASFRLGRFHDRLLGYGSIPVTLSAEHMMSDPVTPLDPESGIA
jgi:hypothetical protein